MPLRPLLRHPSVESERAILARAIPRAVTAGLGYLHARRAERVYRTSWKLPGKCVLVAVHPIIDLGTRSDRGSPDKSTLAHYSLLYSLSSVAKPYFPQEGPVMRRTRRLRCALRIGHFRVEHGCRQRGESHVQLESFVHHETPLPLVPPRHCHHRTRSRSLRAAHAAAVALGLAARRQARQSTNNGGLGIADNTGLCGPSGLPRPSRPCLATQIR